MRSIFQNTPGFSLSFAPVSVLIAGISLAHTAHAADSKSSDSKLEEVVISSLAFRASIDDAIQPVSVLSGTDLQTQLSSSLGETLAKQPGITASYFGPTASRPIIRGMSGERVQMLEDSLSALDVSSLSEDHAVSIEDSLARQIEIVKGPASLLYGSGAVGGVINVLTNRLPEAAPKQATSGMAQARYDSATGERSGVASLDLGGDRIAAHFDGYKKQSDDVRIPGAAFSAQATADALAADPGTFIPHNRIYNSESESKGGAGAVTLFAERGTIGVAVSGFDTFYGVPMAPGDLPGEGSHIDMKQTRYDLKAQLDGNGDWLRSISLRAAHNNYHHAELEADGSVGTAFDQSGTEIRAALDHQLGGLQGSVGVQLRQLDFLARGEESPFVPGSLTRNASVFAFEQYSMDLITLEGGLRVEQQRITPDTEAALPNYSGTAFSASFGGLYKLDDNQSLAINVTRSQRHPGATELYADGVHDATGQFIVGDVTLRPESANTVDLVWRGGEDIHWHFSAYLDQFRDYIYLAPTGEEEEGLPKYQYLQSDARYVGAEGSLRWHLFENGDRHLDAEITADIVRATLADGSAVPQVPPLRTGLTLEYAGGLWQSEVSVFRYASQKRVAENETPTDGYTMVDLSVHRDWMLPQAATLQTFIKGSNLTNVLARRHTSPLKEYAPLPGRSVTVGMTVKF